MPSSGAAHDVVLVAAWCMAISGLVFSYYAALTYVPLAREALREGRAAPPVVPASTTETRSITS